MKHLTLEEKYQRIRNACCNDTYSYEGEPVSVGIHNFGVLHLIADALGMKGNEGTNLRSLNARIAKIMRDLIDAGYPIREGRIKCCSWSPRETWHVMFSWKEKTDGEGNKNS